VPRRCNLTGSYSEQPNIMRNIGVECSHSWLPTSPSAVGFRFQIYFNPCSRPLKESIALQWLRKVTGTSFEVWDDGAFVLTIDYAPLQRGHKLRLCDLYVLWWSLQVLVETYSYAVCERLLRIRSHVRYAQVRIWCLLRVRLSVFSTASTILAPGIFVSLSCFNIPIHFPRLRTGRSKTHPGQILE
jgi:hypothetical protein